MTRREWQIGMLLLAVLACRALQAWRIFAG